MNPDQQHLMILLVAIYLSDCWSLPLSASLFFDASFLGCKKQARSTTGRGRFFRRFWFLRPLIPPFGASFTMPFWPCALGEVGLCNQTLLLIPTGKQEPQFIAYSAIESVAVIDDTLYINQQAWCRSHSAKQLHKLKQVIQQLRIATDTVPVIQQFVRSQSSPRIPFSESIRRNEKAVLPLVCWNAMYAVFLMGYLPYRIVHPSPLGSLIDLLAPLLFLHSISAVLFYAAHKKLRSHLVKERWAMLAKMVLCPPMLLRASDLIIECACPAVDPLAALSAIVAPKRALPLLTQFWRELSYPHLPQGSAEFVEAQHQFNTHYKAALSAMLTKQGLDLDALEIDVQAYANDRMVCPRCEAEYLVGTIECSDCHQITLKQGTKYVH